MASKCRTTGIALVTGIVAISLAACGDDTSSSNDVATVTSTVTASPSSRSSSGQTSTTESSASPGADRRLIASFAELSLSQPVGLAVVPVGGGEAMLFGDQTPRVAWSTIKVPIALAAERKNGPSEAESAAIIDSDNAAAESLWASLGSADQAAAAVTAVLREAGDETTTVPTQKLRPEYTVFGQTTWPLADAATFTADLPCLPGSKHVISLMGQVAGNQQWGIEVIPARSTAVKGGWGPSVSGGYVVRQIGIVTLKNGRQAGVAMSTYAPGASMESGIVALDRVGTWVGRHLAALPSGRCK